MTENELGQRRRSSRRSSILKSTQPLGNLDNINPVVLHDKLLEKRRVSFNKQIMVKEFLQLKQPEEKKEEVTEHVIQPNIPQESQETNPSRVYMVTANESFYQMSTPVGAKKRRISGSSVPSRLSSIPALEQSFIDDSTDFEIFSEDSPALGVSDNEKITISEVKYSDPFLPCPPTDDFGTLTQKEPDQLQIPTPSLHRSDATATQIVDMSLTLEDESHNSVIELIAVQTNCDNVQQIEPAVIFSSNDLGNALVSSKSIELQVNEMDPMAFPTSLLTPPKPTLSSDSKVVLSTAPTTDITSDTCILSQENTNTQAHSNIQILQSQTQDIQAPETLCGDDMSLTACDTTVVIDLKDGLLNSQHIEHTHVPTSQNTCNTTTNPTDVEKPVMQNDNTHLIPSTHDSIDLPVTSHVNNEIHVPINTAGKKRPIISSSAVVSKHLAVGSLKSSRGTPKQQSTIPHLKSPYLTRSATKRIQQTSAMKKKREDIEHHPTVTSKPRCRSVSRKATNAKTVTDINQTFVVFNDNNEDPQSDVSMDPTTNVNNDLQTDMCKTPLNVAIVNPSSHIGDDLQSVHVNNIRDQTFLIPGNQPKNTETTEVHVQENALTPTLPHDVTSESCIHNPKLHELSNNQDQYNWLADECPCIASSSLDTSLDSAVSTDPVVSSSFAYTKDAIQPTTAPFYPLLTSLHHNPPLQTTPSTSQVLQKLTSAVSSLQATPTCVDSSILESPKMEVLDGTINQTTMPDSLDISQPQFQIAANRRRSVDARVMERIVLAAGDANKTLHLEEEYVKQQCVVNEKEQYTPKDQLPQNVMVANEQNTCISELQNATVDICHKQNTALSIFIEDKTSMGDVIHVPVSGESQTQSNNTSECQQHATHNEVQSHDINEQNDTHIIINEEQLQHNLTSSNGDTTSHTENNLTHNQSCTLKTTLPNEFQTRTTVTYQSKSVQTTDEFQPQRSTRDLSCESSQCKTLVNNTNNSSFEKDLDLTVLAQNTTFTKCNNTTITSDVSQQMFAAHIPKNSIIIDQTQTQDTASMSFGENSQVRASEVHVEQSSFLDAFETLHTRFTMFYDATNSRLTNYTTNDRLQEFIKHYHRKISACMCALRCVIDYIRINDMCDFCCDLPSIDWQNSPLLSSDKDKSGLTIDKARWIMELAHSFDPHYNLCQELMKSIETCFGWTLRSWTPEAIYIDVRGQITLVIELDSGSNISCQKVKGIRYELLKNGVVADELKAIHFNHRSVLEIPVIIQTVLQYI